MFISIKNQEQNAGITIKQSIKFFKTYVLDIFAQERFRYKPDNITKNINPKTGKKIKVESKGGLYSEYKKLKEIVIKIKELEELICL